MAAVFAKFTSVFVYSLQPSIISLIVIEVLRKIHKYSTILFIIGLLVCLLIVDP